MERRSFLKLFGGFVGLFPSVSASLPPQKSLCASGGSAGRRCCLPKVEWEKDAQGGGLGGLSFRPYRVEWMEWQR